MRLLCTFSELDGRSLYLDDFKLACARPYPNPSRPFFKYFRNPSISQPLVLNYMHRESSRVLADQYSCLDAIVLAAVGLHLPLGVDAAALDTASSHACRRAVECALAIADELAQPYARTYTSTSISACTCTRTYPSACMHARIHAYWRQSASIPSANASIASHVNAPAYVVSAWSYGSHTKRDSRARGQPPRFSSPLARWRPPTPAMEHRGERLKCLLFWGSSNSQRLGLFRTASTEGSSRGGPC